jgi:hypothetical protein
LPLASLQAVKGDEQPHLTSFLGLSKFESFDRRKMPLGTCIQQKPRGYTNLLLMTLLLLLEKIPKLMKAPPRGVA